MLQVKSYQKARIISKLIVNSITGSIAVAIMVFYLSYDQKLMKQRFLEFFPPKFKEKAEYILDSIKTKVGGYVFAQVLSMLVVGLFYIYRAINNRAPAFSFSRVFGLHS